MILILKLFFTWLGCVIGGHEPWDFAHGFPVLSFTDYRGKKTFDLHICTHCHKLYTVKRKSVCEC